MRNRPENWTEMLLVEIKKVPDPELTKGNLAQALISFAEAGANAMRKADIEWIKEHILNTEAFSKEDWEAFVAEEKLPFSVGYGGDS